MLFLCRCLVSHEVMKYNNKVQFILLYSTPPLQPVMTIHKYYFVRKLNNWISDLILDKHLTWGLQLKNKYKELNSKLHLVRPLLYSLKIKRTIDMAFLRPMWYSTLGLSQTV